MRATAYLLITGVLAIAACGGHGDEHGEHGGGPEADACEHMVEGPGRAATAVAAMLGDGPDVGEHHTRFDVELVAGADGMYSGFVDLLVEEAGITDVFTDVAVPVRVWDVRYTEVMAHHAQSNITECTEVSQGIGYQLGVGTFLLGIGPTTEPTVSLVVVLEGEEH
jgi:hypothetical protein